MPNQTFFNLPEEKREAILNIAIDEFANHNYNSASISRLVAKAKIAKGSFYQYFQDKKELYLYLVEIATQQRLSFIKDNLPATPMGFFPSLRRQFVLSTYFFLSHPALNQVVNRAIYGDLPFRDEALRRTKAVTLGYVEQLVRQGVEQGDINPEINPDIATFTINTLGNELGNFILSQAEISPQEFLQEGKTDVDMKLVEKVFDDLIRLLECGLGHHTVAEPKINHQKTTPTDLKT